MKLPIIVLLLALVTPLSAVAPSASASHCFLFQNTPVGFSTFSVTIPLPGSAGPITIPEQVVGGQTVGGQTVGPFSTPPVTAGPVTVPLVASVSGVPVVGTITIGGQTVGPVFIPSQTVPQQTVPEQTVPQQTVGPVTVGPVPTGLNPIVITVFGQSVDVPLSPQCTIETTFEVAQAVIDFIQNFDICELVPRLCLTIESIEITGPVLP